MTNHFYIHIPFCNQKCPYCKFALTPIFDEFKKRRYIEYLKKEIREYFIGNTEDWNKKTVYFWGGTPSILSHLEIREILECFPFYSKDETEITLESNPEDITREYVEWLVNLWINRLSMGIQTLNEKSLTEIHRSNQESIIDALHCIDQVVNSTPISINIDFILGLPYTLPGEILESVKKLHKEFPCITHTSIYMLEDENYPKHWKSNSITEEEMQTEFIAIMDYFESIWWNHYELSNFAKPGYESIHNQAYWDHSNSRGFGLSAASYENGIRWNNSSSFGNYYKGKVENEEKLTPEQIEIENMMFWLRTKGWQYEWTIENNKKIKQLISSEMIISEKKLIKPTKNWIFVLDHILSELLNS
jgi:oxygen-independent coproporphyrinogen-3 oxidase